MRIISGKARGTKLFSPEGNDTRPTLDRVREAIFSMINFSIPSACVLDLFAGSGAMGLEALSRGAAEAVFVDCDDKAISVVRKNIEKTHSDCCTVRHTDFKQFLSTCSDRFDIIFLDPPYGAGFYEEALSIIKSRNLLSDDGILIAECSTDIKPDFSGFEVYRERKYGKVAVYVLTEEKS